LYGVIGFRGTTHEFDTLNYKAPNLATILVGHSAWSLPFANLGYFTNGYPSNHLLVAGFIALPFGTDAPSYVVNVLAVALLIAGVGALAEAVGGSALAGAGLGAALALAPIALLTQAGSLQEDIAASAGIAAGAALLLASRGARNPVRLAGLGGVALGLGAGAKYTAYVPAVAVIVLAVVLAPKLTRLKLAGFALAGTLVTSGFWLIRDLAHFDNPVYPLGVGPLKAGGSPLRYYETSLLSHAAHVRTGPLRTWLSLGWRFLGVAAIVALAGTAVALVRARRNGPAAGLALTAAFAVLAYTATPYTGGGPEGAAFLIGSQLRYALPALALAAGVAAASLGPRIALVTGFASFLYAAWRLRVDDPARPDVAVDGRWVLVVLVAVACALVAWAMVRRTPAFPSRWKGLVPVGGLALATAIAGAVGTATPRSSPAFDGALAKLGAPYGPVAAVNVGDVRALLGPCLRTKVVAPELGRTGYDVAPSKTALDRAVNALDTPALAVGRSASRTVPSDWTAPPGWTKVASDRGTDLYAQPAMTRPTPQPRPSARCAVRRVP
jgi:hypothetical protein